MTIAAIEAGGTKFVLGLYQAEASGRARPEQLAKASIPTTTPAETLASAGDFFSGAARQTGQPIDVFGIGSFGPVELKPQSPEWGHITATPKPRWSGTDIAGYFQGRFNVPVAFDTDVNAAAYAEFLWGGAQGLSDFVYLTVGTGIGGGIFSGGNLVHGLAHPELGHIRIAREPDDPFLGICPFHRDCLEGLASGPAIAARWDANPAAIPEDHAAWELEARYLARAIAAYVLVLSPELILMGGGVGMRPGLAEKVCDLVGEELAGYVPALARPGKLSGYVSRPQLGSEAGLLGAAALGLRLCAE